MTQPPHDESTASSSEELREQVEQTRHELGETVEDLAAKTDVKSRAPEQATARHTCGQRRLAGLHHQIAFTARFRPRPPHRSHNSPAMTPNRPYRPTRPLHGTASARPATTDAPLWAPSRQSTRANGTGRTRQLRRTCRLGPAVGYWAGAVMADSPGATAGGQCPGRDSCATHHTQHHGMVHPLPTPVVRCGRGRRTRGSRSR
ncbi:DUF3618 domain-containing protein [Streptomyces coeruleorubidus]|uniref:DUF3618 domain-containing protein n=1 Tax=Streptomyces coeruleorubidus TaxID=116188 RepID=UPI003F54248C